MFWYQRCSGTERKGKHAEFFFYIRCAPPSHFFWSASPLSLSCQAIHCLSVAVTSAVRNRWWVAPSSRRCCLTKPISCTLWDRPIFDLLFARSAHRPPSRFENACRPDLLRRRCARICRRYVCLSPHLPIDYARRFAQDNFRAFLFVYDRIKAESETRVRFLREVA